MVVGWRYTNNYRKTASISRPHLSISHPHFSPRKTITQDCCWEQAISLIIPTLWITYDKGISRYPFGNRVIFSRYMHCIEHRSGICGEVGRFTTALLRFSAIPAFGGSTAGLTYRRSSTLRPSSPTLTMNVGAAPSHSTGAQNRMAWSAELFRVGSQTCGRTNARQIPKQQDERAHQQEY